MSPQLALLVRSATDELIVSPVTFEDQAKLARNLEIPWGEVQEFVTPRRGIADAPYSREERERRIEEVVQSSLDIVFSTDSSKLKWSEVERLAKRRIFFETIMAWSISTMPDRQSQLRSGVASIQDQLQELSQSRQFTSEDAQAAWKLDGDFHRRICHISGYDHVAEVVDRVIEACPRWGQATTTNDVVLTWTEHEEMISAMTAKVVDRGLIFDAILRHVNQALDRWRAKEGRMDSQDELQVWQRQAAQWLTARDQPIVAQGEETFLRELPCLLDSDRNKWVAYHGQKRLGFGSDKLHLWKFFARKGYPIDEVVVRKVTPQILTSFEASCM